MPRSVRTGLIRLIAVAAVLATGWAVLRLLAPLPGDYGTYQVAAWWITSLPLALAALLVMRRGRTSRTSARSLAFSALSALAIVVLVADRWTLPLYGPAGSGELDVNLDLTAGDYAGWTFDSGQIRVFAEGGKATGWGRFEGRSGTIGHSVLLTFEAPRVDFYDVEASRPLRVGRLSPRVRVPIYGELVEDDTIRFDIPARTSFVLDFDATWDYAPRWNGLATRRFDMEFNGPAPEASTVPPRFAPIDVYFGHPAPLWRVASADDSGEVSERQVTWEWSELDDDLDAAVVVSHSTVDLLPDLALGVLFLAGGHFAGSASNASPTAGRAVGWSSGSPRQRRMSSRVPAGLKGRAKRRASGASTRRR